MLCCVPKHTFIKKPSSQEDFYSDFTEIHRQHVHGRIVQVPNRLYDDTGCAIEFDKEKTLVDGLTHKDLCSSMPCNTNTKKLLNRGVERANIIDCWCKDKTKTRKHAEVESAKTIVAANLTDSIFLGGTLNQIDDRTKVTQDSGEGTHKNDDDSLSDVKGQIVSLMLRLFK